MEHHEVSAEADSEFQQLFDDAHGDKPLAYEAFCDYQVEVLDVIGRFAVVGEADWLEITLRAAKVVIKESVVPKEYLTKYSRAAYQVLLEGGTDEEARQAILAVS